jgi:hypothetical protein
VQVFHGLRPSQPRLVMQGLAACFPDIAVVAEQGAAALGTDRVIAVAAVPPKRSITRARRRHVLLAEERVRADPRASSRSQPCEPGGSQC